MAMKAGDVMSRHIVSIAPDASILEAVRRLLQYEISGLPVIDEKGHLVGVVTESDLLRREETGTGTKRPRWIEVLFGAAADVYARSRERIVAEVMTKDVVTVDEDATLDQVVNTMQARNIKRLLVMRAEQLVGIISRSDLLRALACLTREASSAAKRSEHARARMTEMERQLWLQRCR